MFPYFSLIFVASYLAFANTFDLTDLTDDPLSFFWNTKDTISSGINKDTICTTKNADGTIKYGVCTHASYCLLLGGKTNGFCGIFGTCCTYEKSCERTTKSKVSYFTNGADIDQKLNCDYNIRLENNNICQVRLDFELFRLNPPTIDNNAYKCLTDSLVITPNTYNIPELCGNNDNQHIYVHVDPTNIKQVNLRINLAKRPAPNMIEPTWKIKITQLECPKDRVFLDKNRNAAKDYDLLAPEGVIQYFTENTGLIKSFGFDEQNNKNSYINGLRYAIAFKKTPIICGVRFTPNYIKMRFNAKALPALYTDTDCTDYLFVPELTFPPPASTVYSLVAKVCLNENPGQSIFSALPPGPVIVDVVTATTLTDPTDTNVYGFNIKYDLLTTC